MKRIILLFTFGIIFLSCNNNSDYFDPTYFADGFKGITFTGPDSPKPIKEDPTDWLPDKNYGIRSGGGGEVSLPQDYIFGPAYPNPVIYGDQFKIDLAIPMTIIINIYAINFQNEVVVNIQHGELSAGFYTFTVETKKFNFPGVYRIILEGQSGASFPALYCKGDVWIKP